MASNKEAEINELKKKVALYEEILDMISEGVFVTDPEGTIVFVNKFSAVMENFDQDSVIGRNQYDTGVDTELFSKDVQHINTHPTDGSRYFFYSGASARMANTYPFYYEGKLENYYSLGFFIDYVKTQLTKILELQQHLMNDQDPSNNETTFTLKDFIGENHKVKELLEIAGRVALKDSNVLIYGETGTGKEIIAQGIHNGSAYREGKFIAVNCAAIPENLMESMLFGSSKGAFTGAIDKKGLIEEAANGTLFLDELNSMPLHIQGKMLRVLQEKQFTRVGGKSSIKASCRFLSALNRDPWDLMSEGTLREDLFFRLSTVTLSVPSLSQRKDDIPLLVNHFIAKNNGRYQLKVQRMDDECLRMFDEYHWPGNVRELEHIVEYMMNITNGNPVLTTKDLPPYFLNAFHYRKEHGPVESVSAQGTLTERVEQFEREIIETTLEKNHFNMSRTARELGIRRETLYYRLKKLNIHNEDSLSKP
ncbi:MAG: sigma-54 interaction domain-containing protein [Clostridia bacterium]